MLGIYERKESSINAINKLHSATNVKSIDQYNEIKYRKQQDLCQIDQISITVNAFVFLSCVCIIND